MKKIVSILSAFAVVASPAFAVTNGSAVVNTGDNNTANSVVNETTNTAVVNTNNTTSVQTVSVSADTGHNSNDRSISTGGAGSSITTGDAGVSVAKTVNAGSNTVAISGGNGAEAANLSEVVNSGDKNKTNVVTNVLNNTAVVNTNNTTDVQTVNAKLNTGYNSSKRTIGGNSIDTGNATAVVTSELNAGTNGVQISGFGTGIGTQNGQSVTNTGDHNTNNSVINATTNTAVVNTNNTTAIQTVWGWINTGHNNGNRSIGGSDIMTGGAGLGVTSEVNAGANAVAIGDGMLPMGASLSEVVNAGDHLQTNNVTNTLLNTNVVGTNNLFESQLVSGHTSTGYNSFKKSIGGGSALTGNAGLGAGLMVNAGVNTTLLGSGLLNWGGLMGAAWWL